MSLQKGDLNLLELVKSKVDKEYFDMELNHIKSLVSEIRKATFDAIDASKDSHKCLRESDFIEIRTNFSSMRNLKIGVVIGIFILILGAVAQYYGFKNTVDNNSKALIEIKESIEKLSDSQLRTNTKLVALEAQKSSEKEVQKLLLEFLKDKKSAIKKKDR